MNRKTSNTASASPRGMSSRGAATLLLLAVLPPVGVAVLWARRVFRPRGRAVLTALSVLWALGIATIILSANQRTQINLPQGRFRLPRIGKGDGAKIIVFGSVVCHIVTSSLCFIIRASSFFVPAKRRRLSSSATAGHSSAVSSAP